MLSLRIQGETRVMAKDQDEYHSLSIRDTVLKDGTPVMLSVWEPTPAELEMLNKGGSVVLSIMGTRFPPVALWAKEPGDDI